MKKVIIFALATVMALGCISAFAAAPTRGWFYGKVGFDEVISSDLFGQSFVGNLESTDNKIREDWTNSRYIADENAIFVNVGTDEAPDAAVKATGTCYANGDYTSNNNLKAYFDMKYTKDALFAGLYLDQSAGYTSTDGNFRLRDNNLFIKSQSGYGFTLRPDNKLDVFISASNSGTYDYITIDLGDYGIDSANWNTYTIYRTTDKMAYVAVNNILIATVDLDGAAGAPITEAGDETNTTLGNNDRYNAAGTPLFAIFQGDDTEIYFDNIGYEEFTDLPAFAKADDYKLELSDSSAKLSATEGVLDNFSVTITDKVNTNGKDWIGLYNAKDVVIDKTGKLTLAKNADGKMNPMGLWTYVNDAAKVTEGVAQINETLRETASGSAKFAADEEYYVVLFVNDGYDAVAYAKFTVEEAEAPATGDAFAIVAVVAVAALALVVLKKKETI